jgi:triphosphoribosyl-dephospho-CoA synthase
VTENPHAEGALVTEEEIGVAVQLACLLEVSAPKPGNVSPGRHFTDTRFEHFLASAAAIGGPLAGAGRRPVGETVRLAVEATRRWSTTNTNLGIILLLAPLARAAFLKAEIATQKGCATAEKDLTRLREAVRSVLADTTVADAREVYAAIRRAAPGGLGRVEKQDVADQPTMTLVEVMRLAADRDGIAREYATAFAVTFDVSVPALERARSDGLSWDDAVVETFLAVLALAPDTHVARRSGAAAAEEVQHRARLVIDAGSVRTAAGRLAIGEMDRFLRDLENASNPGTAADLTAAAILVVLLSGGW